MSQARDLIRADLRIQAITSNDGTDEQAVGLEITLRERGDSQLYAIVEAIARIDVGEYGDCGDCGKRIPKERLEAKPDAYMCVRCQEAVDGSGVQTAIQPDRKVNLDRLVLVWNELTSTDQPPDRGY